MSLISKGGFRSQEKSKTLLSVARRPIQMAVPCSQRHGEESRDSLQHWLWCSKENRGSVPAKSRTQHFQMSFTPGGGGAAKERRPLGDLHVAVPR